MDGGGLSERVGEFTLSVIYKTQAELDAALAYWQKVLRLQDWDIKIIFGRERDMCDPCLGEIITTPAKKMALIKILDPVDYSNPHYEQDHEPTLVHELLHIHFNSIMDEIRDVDKVLHDRLYTQEESAIESIAKGLISLSRSLP